MPVIHTRSADPLDRITLEKGRDDTMHVWLRDNIAETVGDDVEGEGSGNAIPVWEADEVYFHSDFSVLIEDVEADFDLLWALHSAPEVIEPTPEVMTARMEETLLGFTRVLLEDTGRASGEPWVQPTGGHDAYPEGWVAPHNRKTWVSLINGNVWEPGVSGWREVSDGIPAWVQPLGAHDAYMKGDRVADGGDTYTSDVDHNVWPPSDYGWTKD